MLAGGIIILGFAIGGATLQFEKLNAMYPAIVCDAGSTGSRVFSFYLSSNGNSTNSYDVKIKNLGKTPVGLSWYAENGMFRNASDSLTPLLAHGLRMLGPETPIYILATGGVRSLTNSLKEELWHVLNLELKSALSNLHKGLMHLQTLDGTDEAFFGLLASNYILEQMSLADLEKPMKDPVGIVDLGGSSLEVSSAGDDQIIGTHDDILISFKSLGLERLRSLIFEEPFCEFGTGNGGECRRRIKEIIQIDEELRSSRSKMQERYKSRFVGISACVYAMDFAYWIMSLKTESALSRFVHEYPNPSIEAMREACDTVCSLPFLGSLFLQHPLTSSREAPTRCFDVCAITEILDELFPTANSKPRISFIKHYNGVELEWTLGFYLKTHARRETSTELYQLETIYHSEL